MYRSKIIYSLYAFVALLSILTYFNITRSLDLKSENKFLVTYLPNSTGVSVYQTLTPNTMKSNLTTVNNIIGNMIEEGFFYIQQDYSKDNLLDIVLSNGEEEYRILYNRRTRDFMCLSNPFLKNYIPMTYIHE